MLVMFLLLSCQALAQSSGVGVIDSSYVGETFRIVATPGHLLSLTLVGMKPPMDAQADPGSEAPLRLAGFSADFYQGPRPIPVPILSVRGVPLCDPPAVCGRGTRITIQMPFQVTSYAESSTSDLKPFETVRVSYEGMPLAVVPAEMFTRQARIPRESDEIFAVTERFGGGVRNAEDQLVPEKSAVHPGDLLRFVLVGLGGPADAPPTGVPYRGEDLVPIGVSFSFGAQPEPGPIDLTPWAELRDRGASSAAMVPGCLACYRLEVRVPEPPPGLAACSAEIQWNMQITVGYAWQDWRRDSRRLCMVPTDP